MKRKAYWAALVALLFGWVGLVASAPGSPGNRPISRKAIPARQPKLRRKRKRRRTRRNRTTRRKAAPPRANPRRRNRRRTRRSRTIRRKAAPRRANPRRRSQRAKARTRRQGNQHQRHVDHIEEVAKQEEGGHERHRDGEHHKRERRCGNIFENKQVQDENARMKRPPPETPVPQQRRAEARRAPPQIQRRAQRLRGDTGAAGETRALPRSGKHNKIEKDKDGKARRDFGFRDRHEDAASGRELGQHHEREDAGDQIKVHDTEQQR